MASFIFDRFDAVTAKAPARLPKACVRFCSYWSGRLNGDLFPAEQDAVRIAARRAVIALHAMDSGLGVPPPFDAKSELRSVLLLAGGADVPAAVTRLWFDAMDAFASLRS